MGKTLKFKRDYDAEDEPRGAWKLKRQQERKDKKSRRGEFVGQRVERAKGESE